MLDSTNTDPNASVFNAGKPVADAPLRSTLLDVAPIP
jgi:hypothetical protein